MSLGALEYRAGHWQQSITSIAPLQSGSSSYTDGWLYLGMAHWRLGDREEARRLPAKGEQAVAAADSSWVLKTQFKLQLKEARALIEPR